MVFLVRQFFLFAFCCVNQIHCYFGYDVTLMQLPTNKTLLPPFLGMACHPFCKKALYKFHNWTLVLPFFTELESLPLWQGLVGLSLLVLLFGWHLGGASFSGICCNFWLAAIGRGLVSSHLVFRPSLSLVTSLFLSMDWDASFVFFEEKKHHRTHFEISIYWIS
jgi:hypothetical protein